MSPRFLLILFALMISFILKGQEYHGSEEILTFEHFDRLYGLDQNLVNGVMYIPDHPGAKGHPFLTGEASQAGSIQVDEDFFENVMLSYDIDKQDILLNYTHPTWGPIKIILLKKRINSFSLGSKSFEKLELDETGLNYYQVLGTGRNKCCIYWYKSLNQSSTGNSFYVFSEPKRKLFLMKPGKAFAIRSKGSFLKMFDPANKSSLKAYFRENQIKLKTASDTQLEGLLNFCNDLPENR